MCGTLIFARVGGGNHIIYIVNATELMISHTFGLIFPCPLEASKPARENVEHSRRCPRQESVNGKLLTTMSDANASTHESVTNISRGDPSSSIFDRR